MTRAHTGLKLRRFSLLAACTACLICGILSVAAALPSTARATAPATAMTTEDADNDVDPASEYGSPADGAEDSETHAPSVPLYERPPHAGYAASEWRVASADRSGIAFAFTVDLLPVQAELIITDASGNEMPAGVPSTEGRTVMQPFTDPLDDGRYSVRWQVVAADGHPMSAEVELRYAAGSSAPEISYPTLDAAALEAPPAGSTTPAGSGSEDAPAPVAPRTALFAAGGALVGVAGFALARRRSTNRGAA